MSQSIAEFATIILYVTIGFCLLVSLLDKNRSFKTVDHGTLFISTDPLLKNADVYNVLKPRRNHPIQPERSKTQR